jgi:hypothetical protein
MHEQERARPRRRLTPPCVPPANPQRQKLVWHLGSPPADPARRPTEEFTLRFIGIIAAAASATAITGAGVAGAQIVDPDPITLDRCERAVQLEPRAHVVDGSVTGNPMIGTPGRDIMLGTDAPEHIPGRGGNDLICAKDGHDVIQPGNGDDTLVRRRRS